MFKTLTSLRRSTVLAALLLVAPGVSEAKSILGASYDISIAGFIFAKGSLSLDLKGQSYSARVGMRPSGVAKIIVSGKSNAESTGSLNGSRVLPARYNMIAEDSEQSSRVSMDMGRGSIQGLAVSPELSERAGRVPVTNRHKQGIVDPLSAILMPVANARDGLAPKACDRRLPIFDGWTRYDVQLSYKRTEQVSGRGYDGPVVVCEARWIPVAGHRPGKKTVQFMIDNRDIEVWLAPIDAEGLHVPYRISMRTMTGELVVQARKLELRGGERQQAQR